MTTLVSSDRPLALHPVRGRLGRPAPAGPPPRGRSLALFPPVTLALFLAPVGVGLAGTWAPAFGYLPALGGTTVSLEPWRALIDQPGLAQATGLSLWVGVASTLVSLAIALGIVATAAGTRAMAGVQRVLSPLLAVPHAAMAIGLAFLIAPSGWMARLVSPGLTGWDRPPDLLIVNDPAGMALILGLVLKETPFLLLMLLAAQAQTGVDRQVRAARTLGYGPVRAWLTVALPQLYPLMRLPIFAVLAFSLSVVDVALLLGPTTPPPLSILVLRWFNDPDLSMRFLGAAGASVQLLITMAAIGLWLIAERVVARIGRPALSSGHRGGRGTVVRIAALGIGATAVALALAAAVAVILWSVAGFWRFPDAVPGAWSLRAWSEVTEGLVRPARVTLLVGLAATALAVVLVIGCLQYERVVGVRPTTRALWLLFVPLLVPQISFLFGFQVFLVALDLDGGWLALVWSHLLFVLPYVFLALADPWRALDRRYARAGLGLGARPWRVFLRIELPLMLRPILVAVAIGFAVSVAQYLPTVFAGGGRLPTLTTEAVTLALGADRRTAGVVALLQAALPLIGFAAALLIPAWMFRNRKGLRA